MRGKEPTRHIQAIDTGITPAYAGKSCEFVGIAEKSGDHPRLCGEKTFSQAYTDAKIGSPPPMRGKAQKQACESFNDRITPAYAGKRCTPQSYPAICRDHPRLCGEKLTFFRL